MKTRLLTYCTVPALLCLALASPSYANDDMAIFSGVTQLNCNNGYRIGAGCRIT